MKRIILLLVAVISLSSFSTPRTPLSVDGEKAIVRVQDSSKVKISITDEQGRTVYSKVFNNGEVGKVFNFENAYPNTYKIVVRTENAKFQTRLTIK